MCYSYIIVYTCDICCVYVCIACICYFVICHISKHAASVITRDCDPSQRPCCLRRTAVFVLFVVSALFSMYVCVCVCVCVVKMHVFVVFCCMCVFVCVHRLY